MNADGIFDCSHNRTAIGVNGPERVAHLKTIIEDPEHRPVMGRIIPPAAGTVSTGPVTSFHVPIFGKDGMFLGTLGGAINFNDLKDKYLKDVAILEQGYATIKMTTAISCIIRGLNLWAKISGLKRCKILRAAVRP